METENSSPCLPGPSSLPSSGDFCGLPATALHSAGASGFQKRWGLRDGGIWEAWGLGGSPRKVSGAKGWFGSLGGLGGDRDDLYQTKQRKDRSISWIWDDGQTQFQGARVRKLYSGGSEQWSRKKPGPCSRTNPFSLLGTGARR